MEMAPDRFGTTDPRVVPSATTISAMTTALAIRTLTTGTGAIRGPRADPVGH